MGPGLQVFKKGFSNDKLLGHKRPQTAPPFPIKLMTLKMCKLMNDSFMTPKLCKSAASLMSQHWKHQDNFATHF